MLYLGIAEELFFTILEISFALCGVVFFTFVVTKYIAGGYFRLDINCHTLFEIVILFETYWTKSVINMFINVTDKISLYIFNYLCCKKQDGHRINFNSSDSLDRALGTLTESSWIVSLGFVIIDIESSFRNFCMPRDISIIPPSSF